MTHLSVSYKTKTSVYKQFHVLITFSVSSMDWVCNQEKSYLQKMSSKTTNTTKFCASKVSFAFQKIPPELSCAKHTRIMRIFAEALVRNGQGACEDGIEAKGEWTNGR